MELIYLNIGKLNAILMVIAGIYYTDILFKIKGKYRNKYSSLGSWILGFIVLAYSISALAFLTFEVKNNREFIFMLCLIPAQLSKALLMYWVHKFHAKNIM